MPPENSDPWKPVQYKLEWGHVPNARYRLFSCGQAMNDNYWTKDTNGVWTSVVVTNKDFSPWFQKRYSANESDPTNEWSFDVTNNSVSVFQGKSAAGIKFFVVAVLNNTNMYKTSNIVGWPTNWNTISTNNFSLKLIRLPVGPPMYINSNPPFQPKFYGPKIKN
jgi:hypothetical protein